MGNEQHGTIIVDTQMGSIDSVLGGIKQIQGAFNGLKLPANMTGNMLKDFDKLKETINKIKNLSTKQTFTNTDMKSLNKLSSQAENLFSKLSNSMDELSGKQIYLQADLTKIKAVETELDNIKAKIQSELSNLKINMDAGGTAKSLGMDQIITDMEKGVRSSKVLSAAMQDVKQAITAGDFSKAGQIFGDIEQKAVSLKGAGSGLLEIFRQWGVINFSGPAKDITDTEQKSKLLSTAITQIINQLNTSNGGQVFKDLNKDLGDTTNKLENVKRAAEANYTNSMKGLAGQVRDTGQATSQATDEMKKYGQSTLDAANQLKQLQQSTQYFFGLRNMINLLRRGIRQAVDTVKDLDKAMTETAVVTKFSVSDMWGKLPEYTKNANALGATVLDMYKATTLYYQQGLNTEQAMSIAAETMKMARIGGLEAADATDKMTAALRGFNMEINETSAQRINDVYSNLAAKTASNTEELGTAMQRTASIANSAGMSFEGTAAFLAQAIETTREPAENLGTAMKTIVARFQELKKNPLEITDVEGEEVSYNKVDTALQSIGVSLKDTNGQFRDLDQVFLDISQRWDSLTQTQQRYVATTAAGSRQQSRFIAMMSNYGRTVQLMDYANNAEGASAEQFEKTLDSLEAKLNKFQNAWKEFLMGITNSNIIKGAVDGLTFLLDKVNKLIDALSLGQGPLKSILSLFAAFTGLKIGGRVINSLIGGLGGLIDPNSTFGAGARSGMITSKASGNPILASQIYTPIVNAINALKGVVNSRKSSILTPEQARYNLFKNAKHEIAKMSNGGFTGKQQKISDFTKQFYGLSKKDQATLANSYGNTFNTAVGSILKQYGFKGADKKALLNATGTLKNMRDRGDISHADFLNQLQDRHRMAQILSTKNKGGQYDSIISKLNESADKTVTDYLDHIAKGISENSKLAPIQRSKNIEKLYAAADKNKEDMYAKAAAWQASQNPENTFKNSFFGSALDKIGGFGAGLQSAGMGLTSFGSLLQNSANPAVAAFGAGLSSIGSLVSGLGMGITGLSSVFSSAASGLMTTFGLAAGAATGLIAAFAGLAAIIAAAVILEKKRQKDIKDKAEKITNDYKEKTDKSNNNVTNLNSWKADLARLSKGIDKNGNNINLDNSDYQRYLEIADGIAEINPEIVKGYNAQGHAIIDNNTALEETLDLEKDIQKQALEEYTSDDAIKALIEARDLEKTTKYDSTASWRKVGSSKTGKQKTELVSILTPQVKMIEQAQKMVRSLKEAGLSDEDFKGFGINLKALEQGDQAAITALERNLSKFTARAKDRMEEAGEEVADSTKEAFNKSISGFSKAADELDELITPLYNALSTKMANEKAFESIPEDMVTYFNQGLKTIASDANLSSNEMISKARDLSTEFVNLTEKGGDYNKVMEQVAEAQEKFGENLDATAYEKVADEAVEDLRNIQKEIDKTSSYAPALTEFLDNQIAQIEKFTEEGAVNITDALNTMTDEIAAAEGALENFQSVAEGSNFTTAANNMKEIYETITSKDNEHKVGEGDQTYWAGAEALLGRDLLEKKGTSKKAVDAMLKNLEPMLKAGQEGWDNFKRKQIEVLKNHEKIVGLEIDQNGLITEIDDNLNPDAYKEVAEALGMSEDFLVSMLNKGRQFGEISFANLKDVRQGLAASNSVIQGQDKTAGKKTLYIKKETLNAELAQAGIANVKDQRKYRKQLETEQGIKVITEAAKIGIEEFQDMGIHSQESLIAVLDDTGQFTKAEIQAYAEQYAKKDENASKFNKEDFDEAFKAHEAIKDPVSGAQLESLQSLDTTVASIAEMMADNRLEEGHLDNPKAEAAEKMLFGGKSADTEAQRFAIGKNVEGEGISYKEYQKTSKDLNNFVTESTEYVKKLEEGKQNAKTSEEKQKYQDEINRFNYMIERAMAYLAGGKKAYHKENNNKIEAINEKTGGLLKGQTWENYKGKKALALQDIYEATLEPKEVTDSFVESLHTAGLKLKEALGAGLVTEESCKAYREKAKEEEKKKNDAESKGKDEANKENEQLEKQKGKEDQTKRNKKRKEGEDEANKEPPESVAPTNTFTEEEKDLYSGGLNTEGLKKWWDNVVDFWKISADKNMLGYSPEDIDTSGLDNAADKTGEAGEQAENAAKDFEKAGISVSNIANAVTGGLSNIIKGVKTFTQIAEGGSPSLQGKAPEGTTIPGVGYVDKNGKVLTGTSSANQPEQPTVESQTVTLTIEANYTQVTEAKTEIQSVIDLANKGAVIRISSGTDNIDTTQKKLANMEKKASKNTKGGDINFSTSVNSQGADKGIQDIVKKANKTVAKVKVTSIKAEGAYSAINELKSYAQKDVSFGVNVKPGNKKNFTVTVKAAALGLNNTGKVPSLPAGSLAAGTNKPGTGRIGPKGNGGLTLTGEEGYEVAWLPRENKSLILGVKGPEMINLPGDAVVWNHEQSKQIVKKGMIPSGSAAVGAGSAHTEANQKMPGEEDKEKTPSKKKKNKNDKDKDDKQKKNAKNAGKTIAEWMKWAKKVGKINNWWENISRQVESVTRQISKTQKTFDTILQKSGITLTDLQGTINNYEKQLGLSIKLNTEIADHYEKALKNLDTVGAKNGGKGGTKQYNNKQEARSELKAAIEKAGSKGKVVWKGKTYSVKDAKKLLNKYKDKTPSTPKNSRIVSWDDTAIVKVTSGKGKGKGKKGKPKNKKVNVKRKAAIDFSKIIDYDEETGTYLANTKAINDAARITTGKNKGKVNKTQAQAIQKKANELIKEYTQRLNDANDKIEQATEDAKKIGEQIYQTFDSWKNELTEVAALTQKIADLEKKIELSETHQTLINSIVESGYADAFSGLQSLVKQGFAAYEAQLYQTTKNVNETSDLLAKKSNEILANAKEGTGVDETYRKELIESLNKEINDIQGGKKLEKLDEDEQIRIAELQGRLDKLEEEQERVEQARKYFEISQNKNTGVIEYTIDYEQLEKDRRAGKTEADYNAIKELKDQIDADNEEIYDLWNKYIDKSSELFNNIKELKEAYADRADELLDMYQESEQKKIDKLKILNDSIVNSLKELLDEVRNRLEARRQKEDNIKTEEDIAKKQQRLATLQADTSGGHQSEILQLQKELNEAQQQYGRTLEDQLLDKLSKQGDVAEKQRERQIKLLQAQRDISQVNGDDVRVIEEWLSNPEQHKKDIENLWNEFKKTDTLTTIRQELLGDEFNSFFTDISKEEGGLLSKISANATAVNGLKETLSGKLDTLNNEENNIVPKTFRDNVMARLNSVAQKLGTADESVLAFEKLRDALYNSPSRANMSAADKAWETLSDTQKAQTNYGRRAEILAQLEAQEARNSEAVLNFEKLRDTLYSSPSRANMSAADKAWGALSNIQKAQTNYGRRAEILAQLEAQEKTNTNPTGSTEPTEPTITSQQAYEAKIARMASNNKIGKEEFEAGWTIAKAAGKGMATYLKDLAQTSLTWKQVINAFDAAGGDRYRLVRTFNTTKFQAGYNAHYGEGKYAENLKKAKELNKKVYAYASGGLATHTGPAWLDGTRAKPEMVLSATDTKNFIALKDVLSDVIGHISDTSNTTYGDSNYEININVDHLNNDYDVDKVAKRVEKIITHSASYRNVTAVSRLR